MPNALIVVDPQNDFAHPDGSLFVKRGEEVIAQINRLVDEYDYVVYTQDFHPPVTSHFEEHGGQWPAHCVAGTWGAEFHDGLRVIPDAPVVKKGLQPAEDGYSGFYVATGGGTKETSLHKMLRAYKIDTVDIVGLALDVCVKATALDANELGYYTTVITKATAPVTMEGGAEAVLEMLEAGINIE